MLGTSRITADISATSDEYPSVIVYDEENQQGSPRRRSDANLEKPLPTLVKEGTLNMTDLSWKLENMGLGNLLDEAPPQAMSKPVMDTLKMDGAANRKQVHRLSIDEYETKNQLDVDAEKAEDAIDVAQSSPESSPAVSRLDQHQSQPVDSPRKRRCQKELALAVVNPATARKCMINDYYFLDHYFDVLTYLHQRKLRTAEFKENAKLQNWTADKLNYEWKLYCAQESAYLRKRRCRTNAAQFQMLAQIGQGGYGQVFLAKKKDTGEVCALKKMSKKLLLKMNEVQHILTERDVLTQTKTPWLVKLFYSFQDEMHVYLAMEYVPGGDIRTLLNNSGILRERDARFYISEMFVAVNELHRIGYIHRDLKPENFLIDTSGHIKLTDFGLSKGQLNPMRVESLRGKLESVQSAARIHYTAKERRSLHNTWRAEHMTRAFSLVGSPDYMAPEIITNAQHHAKSDVYSEGYDYLVDYWSLGCILFEFLCGYPPFAAPSIEEVWTNVYHWQEVLERPVYEGKDAEFNLSDESWNLITELVAHRHKRLGSILQVQHHPWFADFNQQITVGVNSNVRQSSQKQAEQLLWTHLRTVNTIQPPFIPALKNEADHSHFDDFSDPRGLEIYKEVYEKQQRLEQEESRTGGSTLEQQEQLKKAFVGFTFRHKNAVGWQDVMSQVPALPKEEDAFAKYRRLYQHQPAQPNF